MTEYKTTISWGKGTEKETRSFTVDFKNLPDNAKEKIIAYGCQRVFNDAVGGKDKFDTFDDKCKFVEKMIENYENGIIGRAPGAPKVSTLQSTIYKLARAALKTARAKAGKDMKTFTGLDKIKQLEILDKVITQLPGIEAQAQAILDAQRAAQVDIDLSEL